MLRKTYRLSRPAIISLRKTGRQIQTSYFTIVLKPNSLKHLRLSIEVSLKVDKRSSRRNFLRRQIYLQAKNSSLTSRGFDILVIAKPTIASIWSDLPLFRSTISQLINILLKND